jgi:hypothetical protein
MPEINRNAPSEKTERITLPFTRSKEKFFNMHSICLDLKHSFPELILGRIDFGD